MPAVHSLPTPALLTLRLRICNNEQHKSPESTQMAVLTYQARTQTRDVFDFEFPLHADTGSAERVGDLVSVILAMIDQDLKHAGEMTNGDVLQALAMALAVRARMIHASPELISKLAKDLVNDALGAATQADRQSPPTGHG